MTEKRGDRNFLEIIEIIEAAAFDPDLWERVVDKIWQQLPGAKLVFHTRDKTMPGTAPVLLRGWDPRLIASYEAHYAALNPWVKVMVSAPLMVPLWTEDTLPASSFVRSEFHADWLRNVGDAECATGIKLMQRETRSASFDVHYGSARMEENHRRATELLSAISPALYQSLAAMRIKLGSPTRNIMEMLIDAAFIVSERGDVRALNGAAQELVDHRIVVLRSPAGRLSVQSESADQALHDEIVNVYGQLQSSRSLTIRATVANELLLISVFPVTAPDSSLAGMASLFHPRREALVVIRRMSRDMLDDVQQFSDKFRLSAAETRLVRALGDGLTLKEAAEQSGIARETARTLLHRVFGKVGVRRQVDLVRLLLSFKG